MIKTPCQAIVESAEHIHGARHYPRQHITAMGSKPCSRSATGKVGPLDLCSVHTRMAREGLIDESGHVASKASIADVRRYPEKFPHGLYRWAS
jgi:hypothetical protein